MEIWLRIRSDRLWDEWNEILSATSLHQHLTTTTTAVFVI